MKNTIAAETNLQKATNWINEQAKLKDTGKSLDQIVSEAQMRFNLSPSDGMAVERLYLHK